MQERTTCTRTMGYAEQTRTLTTDMANILDTTRRMILKTCITGQLASGGQTTALTAIGRGQTFRELSSSQATAESRPIPGIPRMKYAEDSILPTRRQAVTAQPTTHPTDCYTTSRHSLSDNTSPPFQRPWLQPQRLAPPLPTPQSNSTEVPIPDYPPSGQQAALVISMVLSRIVATTIGCLQTQNLTHAGCPMTTSIPRMSNTFL